MAASLVNSRSRIPALALLIIPAFACLGLLLFVTLPSDSRAWSATQNVGHFFLFAGLAIVYIIQIEKLLDWKFLQNVIVTAILLTTLGVLAEGAQGFLPGRDASSSDLWRNSAGILTGLICYTAFYLRPPAVILATLLLFAVSIILLISRPAIELVSYSFLKSPPPSVMSFTDPFVYSMISSTGGAKTTLQGTGQQKDTAMQGTLRMDFAQEPYSGVILHEPGSEWPRSGNLMLRIFNADNKTRLLELRIHDVLHNNQYDDRFNTKFYVKAGNNEVLIPLDEIRSLGGAQNKRFMDLQNISELQIFSSIRDTFTLYLRGLYLTQQ